PITCTASTSTAIARRSLATTARTRTATAIDATDRPIDDLEFAADELHATHRRLVFCRLRLRKPSTSPEIQFKTRRDEDTKGTKKKFIREISLNRAQARCEFPSCFSSCP